MSCIYCAAEAKTRDHVPPKCLLETPQPLNLRVVPSCQACNSGWALDEQYFAIVLAHVGDRPHLSAKLEEGGSVDRALEYAPKLDDKIIASLNTTADGRIFFEPDIARIGRIAAKVAFGLFCLQYGPGTKLGDFSTSWVSGPGHELPQHLIAAQWNWPGIRRKRWTHVQKNIFSYLFAKGWMVNDPPLYCLINFHETVVAAVSCPAGIGRPKQRRLRAKPWI